LIRELLISEGSTSIQLNEEQRSALAFLNARPHATANMNTSHRQVTCYRETEDSPVVF